MLPPGKRHGDHGINPWEPCSRISFPRAALRGMSAGKAVTCEILLFPALCIIDIFCSPSFRIFIVDYRFVMNYKSIPLLAVLSAELPFSHLIYLLLGPSFCCHSFCGQK